MNKIECFTLRGIAIICIILHNYCHWLPFTVHENEFSFSLDNTMQFWQSNDLETFIPNVFSFWGHWGVPIFVFLTGYGLSLKYDGVNNLCRKSFIARHYKKLCVPMIIGLFFYYLINCLRIENIQEIISFIPIKRIVSQITLITNLFPQPNNEISPGPYWYFGMTMQLYLIYLYVVHKKKTMYIITFGMFFLIISALLNRYPVILLWVKYNSIGWLTPFLCGIIFARYKYKIIYDKAIIISIVTFVLILFSELNYYTWLLTPVFVILHAIHIINLLPKFMCRTFWLIGEKSSYIFVVHPIVREITIKYGTIYNPYIGILLYITILLITIWIIEKILNFRFIK